MTGEPTAGGTGAGRQTAGRRQLRPTDVKRLNRTWRRGTQSRLALILESVTGPFNIGSIFRTAAAFGVETIWLAGNATPPTNPKAQKTALGTDRLVEWHRAVPVVEAAGAARERGYRIVAVELTGDAVPLPQAALDGDVCLLLGGEDHGCSPAALEAADAVVYIPQVGRVGSVNVSIAAGIVMAEARRQEWATPSAPPSTASGAPS
ncbi:TrmH family RNA methyltransferase [Sphaerimonospora sp. CA-214678]|uniref:TrmH family RNA methyltransferase n=1 Tax=Sphaerimonospora sp. CA-214678 TaxID=3240029 RepID=UPI003D931DD1